MKLHLLLLSDAPAALEASLAPMAIPGGLGLRVLPLAPEGGRDPEAMDRCVGVVVDLRADPGLDLPGILARRGLVPQPALPLLVVLPGRVTAERVDRLLELPGAEIFTGPLASRALAARVRSLVPIAARLPVATLPQAPSPAAAEAPAGDDALILRGVARVTAALNRNLDFDATLRGALEEILAVLGCDRAYLAHIPRPDAAELELPFLAATPAFPGPPEGVTVPMDEFNRAVGADLARSADTLAYGPENPPPGYAGHRAAHGMQSMMVVSLAPTGERLWVLGVHQCTHARAWTAAEKRLLKEISLRVAQVLANLLHLRALKESEARLQRVLDSLPVMVWMSGRDTRAEYFNRRWLDFRGRALAEERGEGWLAGVHPDDRERVLRTCLDCFEGRLPYHLEYRLLRHDGEWRWVSDHASPLVLADGTFSGFIGGCLDITGHRLLEEDMRRSRDSLQAILGGVRSAVMMMGADGRIHFANEQAARQLGFARAEDLMAAEPASLVSPWDILDEEGLPFPHDRFPNRVAFREGRASEAIFRYRRKGGTEERWSRVKASPVVDAAGKVSRVVQILEDITSLKQSEMEARESRRRLDVILQGIDNGILVHEPGGGLAYVNSVAARMAGFADPEAALAASRDPEASPFARLELQDEAGNPLPRDRWPAATALRGEEFPPTLLRMRADPAAAERWIMCSAKPLRDEAGRAALAVTIYQDMTDLRQAEERLRQSQKMDALGQLAGGIAHDFNNLLTAINGYSQLAIGHQAEPEALQEYLREIAAAGEKAAGLTRQLLSFSRKQKAVPRPLDLNEAVSGLEGLLARLLGEDIRFHTVLDRDLPAVLGDKTQLDQVLMNLCLNARDAMPAGGVLQVETRAVEAQGKGWFGDPAVRPGRYVQLEVSDTGVGMSPSVRSRIFEPFFTTKGKDKGTGLGLSTVYSIVRQMGGHIHVTSAPGKGTVFRILFPARSAADGAPEGESPAGTRSAAGRADSRAILLVEDDVRVQKLATAVLRARGYQVHAFGSGEAAVDWAGSSETPLHLLLSDVVLPGMGGAEVVTRIQALRPELPVALMSGYTDDALVRKGVGDSKIPFLQKPFVPSGLLEFVGGLVAPRSAAGSAA